MPERPYHHGDLRAALLAAAETLLERGGPDALTLRAAAREAGVSHAAPAHHFGDLSGLLSALAASGFERFRARLRADVDAAGSDPGARLSALGAGYIGFAGRHPGLFGLMFRSARLDWSLPALAQAGQAAFALLLEDRRAPDGEAGAPPALDRLALALSRWSLAHGAAMLAVDGRLDAFATEAGVPVAALVAAIARHLPPAP